MNKYMVEITASLITILSSSLYASLGGGANGGGSIMMIIQIINSAKTVRPGFVPRWWRRFKWLKFKHSIIRRLLK